MNENAIRELLARYMEGETTLAEERVLKGYFALVDEIPADIEYACAMFGHFAAAASQRPGRALEIRGSASAPRNRRRRTWIWTASAIAAAVVMAILFVPLKGDTDGEVIYCYINGEPVTDFELAYAYTQGAFGLIEGNIKKAEESLIPIGEAGNLLESLRYLELLGLLGAD